jgi:hypothetical protein
MLHQKRVKLRDVLGERVGNGGESESIHICLSCGKPKLYVNMKTHLFHCFYCGVCGSDKNSGFYSMSLDTEVSINVEEPKEFNLGRILNPLQRVVPAHFRERGYSHIPAVTERLLQDGPRILTPLFLDGVTVGYAGTTGDHTYRSYGTRGVGWAVGERDITQQFHQVLVYEGFYDWCSGIASTVGGFLPILMDNVDWYTTNMAVGFTAGSTLSLQQVMEIVARTHEDGIIFICFDSDLPYVAFEAARRLSFWRKVQVCLPKSYKDWDDAYHGRIK